jgi:hypothetical protein
VSVTFDREKRWQALLAEGPEPSVPLAVPPHFYVTLRRHPEVGVDKMAAMAAVLVRYAQQLDRDLGGQGQVFYDPAGTRQTDAGLTLRLVTIPGGNFLDRFEAIYRALGELKATARREVADTQDADINARIDAELASPVAREVAERLELTPVR